MDHDTLDEIKASALFNHGNLFIDEKNYLKAKEKLQEGLKIIESQPKLHEMKRFDFYLRSAYVEINLDSLDIANHLIEESEKILTDLKFKCNDLKFYEVYLTKGDLCLNTQNYEDAISNYNESLNIYESHFHKEEVDNKVPLYLGLAESYYAIGNFVAAQDNYLKSKRILVSLKIKKDLILLIYGKLVEISIKLNENEQKVMSYIADVKIEFDHDENFCKLIETNYFLIYPLSSDVYTNFNTIINCFTLFTNSEFIQPYMVERLILKAIDTVEIVHQNGYMRENISFSLDRFAEKCLVQYEKNIKNHLYLLIAKFYQLAKLNYKSNDLLNRIDHKIIQSFDEQGKSMIYDIILMSEIYYLNDDFNNSLRSTMKVYNYLEKDSSCLKIEEKFKIIVRLADIYINLECNDQADPYLGMANEIIANNEIAIELISTFATISSFNQKLK